MIIDQAHPVGVDRERLNALLAEFPVLVVPGFFGYDEKKRLHLLGRVASLFGRRRRQCANDRGCPPPDGERRDYLDSRDLEWYVQFCPRSVCARSAT
jgi:hypothetical protein